MLSKPLSLAAVSTGVPRILKWDREVLQGRARSALMITSGLT